jgi:hypothetical protein
MEHIYLSAPDKTCRKLFKYPELRNKSLYNGAARVCTVMKGRYILWYLNISGLVSKNMRSVDDNVLNIAYDRRLLSSSYVVMNSL